ncbi:unnamed protein product, partial [Schistosoma haematobium]
MVRVVASSAIVNSSGHLEYESTSIRYVIPSRGPVKSICTRDQGFSDFGQGTGGKLGGIFAA